MNSDRVHRAAIPESEKALLSNTNHSNQLTRNSQTNGLDPHGQGENPVTTAGISQVILIWRDKIDWSINCFTHIRMKLQHILAYLFVLMSGFTLRATASGLPLSTWIGPGDMIHIKAYPDTTLFITGNYPILADGYAILPMVGLVKVTTESVEALAESLTKQYSKFLPFPTLQIEPITLVSFLGGFLNPGIQKVNPTLTFAEALKSAQGPLRDDGLRKMRWERGGKVLASDLTDLLESPRSLAELGFRSRDQICVTLLTQRDRLPMISLIVSTILASATLTLTVLAVTR